MIWFLHKIFPIVISQKEMSKLFLIRIEWMFPSVETWWVERKWWPTSEKGRRRNSHPTFNSAAVRIFFPSFIAIWGDMEGEPDNCQFWLPSFPRIPDRNSGNLWVKKTDNHYSPEKKLFCFLIDLGENTCMRTKYYL